METGILRFPNPLTCSEKGKKTRPRYQADTSKPGKYNIQMSLTPPRTKPEYMTGDRGHSFGDNMTNLKENTNFVPLDEAIKEREV